MTHPAHRFTHDFALLKTMSANLHQRMAYAKALSSYQSLTLENIMADLEALTAKTTELEAAVSEFETREAATIESLNAVIADLKEKGSPDLGPIVDRLSAVIAGIPQATPPAA